MKKIIIMIFILMFSVSVVNALDLSIRWDADTTPSTGTLVGRFSNGLYYSQAQNFQIVESVNVSLKNLSINVNTVSGSGSYKIEITNSKTTTSTLCLSDVKTVSTANENNFKFSSDCILEPNIDYWFRIVIDGSFNTDVWFYTDSQGGTDYGGSTYYNWRSGESSASVFNYGEAYTTFDISSKLYYEFIENVTPVLEFTNITANNITLTNNTFYNSSIDFETFVLNTSTNGNVNHAYSLNGNASIQYATNNLNGSVNLNLSDGYYNISFQVENNETSVNSTNYSFIVDTTPPTISVIGNVTRDSYLVNFSEIFDINYSISGEKSCSINITYLEANESDSNFLINCTDTQSFTRAGLYNGFLTAEDNAGNIVTGSVNGTINPVINVFFNNTVNGSLILNYSATIFHPDGRETIPTVQPDGSIQLSPVNDGELDLGNHTIQFSQGGFTTANYTQIVNETNAGTNVTFNVSLAKLIINIYDRTTKDLITDNVTVELVGTIGEITSTNTGLINITNFNFINEDYVLILKALNYETESLYFHFTNQETINVTGYMLKSNDTYLGTHTIKVETEDGKVIEGAAVRLLEWSSEEDAYITTSQVNSNSIGEALISIELGQHLYKFIVSKDGYSKETSPVIIYTTGGSTLVTLETGLTEPAIILQGITGSLNYTQFNATHITAFFTGENVDGLNTEFCLNVYDVVGVKRTLTYESCSSSTSVVIPSGLLDVNKSVGVYIEGTAFNNDKLIVIDSILFPSYINISEILEDDFGFLVLVPLFLILSAIALGFMIGKIFIGGSLVIVMVWVSNLITATYMPSKVAGVLTVITLLIVWGSYKK